MQTRFLDCSMACAGNAFKRLRAYRVFAGDVVELSPSNILISEFLYSANVSRLYADNFSAVFAQWFIEYRYQ